MKLKDSHQAQALLESQIAQEKEKLDVQISVNREIMQRKESFEWELMEMQAQQVRIIAIPCTTAQTRL